MVSGFSLAEVIVAMTLLSIATLAVAGTGLVAIQTFTQAEMQETALREAEFVLDSLLALKTNTAGVRHARKTEVSWSAADSAGAIVVRVTVPGRSPFELTAVR